MEVKNGEQLLELMRGFQMPCVLAAAADLDVFQQLAATPMTAPQLAERLAANAAALTILLDALTGVGVLVKAEGRYALQPALMPVLVNDSPTSVAAMLRHQANCLRRWARLPWVVQSGKTADGGGSLRGPEVDEQSFIEAMHVVSRAAAEPVIAEVHPGGVRCVLDIGGASGTWTAAWLRAEPAARAILFDLPSVIPLAQQRVAELGLADRVTLVPGDYHSDPLPTGADLVWLSAIIHQNSPEQNRALYRRIASALEPGGWLLIRDIVMEPSRTAPLVGALFAVNMLVGTDGGNCVTWPEIQDDLEAAGFAEVQWLRRDEGMNSVVSARRSHR